MKNTIKASLVLVLICFLRINTVQAQNFYMEPSVHDKTSVGIRYLRPFFKEGEQLSGLAGTYEFSIRYSLNPRLKIIASIPYSIYSEKEIETESGVGNLYLGLQIPQKNQKTNISVGINFPTASDSKMYPNVIGFFADYYRFNNYIPESFTFYGNFAYRSKNTDGAILALEAGPNVLISTGGNDFEMYLHYGLQGGYRFKSLSIFAELTGLMVLSEKDIDFSDRVVHNLSFGAEYSFNKLSLGVFYALYLDDMLDDIRVLGVKFKIYF